MDSKPRVVSMILKIRSCSIKVQGRLCNVLTKPGTNLVLVNPNAQRRHIGDTVKKILYKTMKKNNNIITYQAYNVIIQKEIQKMVFMKQAS